MMINMKHRNLPKVALQEHYDRVHKLYILRHVEDVDEMCHRIFFWIICIAPKRVVELESTKDDAKAHVKAEAEAKEVMQDDKGLQEEGFKGAGLEVGGADPCETQEHRCNVYEHTEEDRRRAIYSREALCERSTCKVYTDRVEEAVKGSRDAFVGRLI